MQKNLDYEYEKYAKEIYKDVLILIEYKKFDENFEVIDGNVIYYKDKNEVCKKLLELKKLL
jgi:hypothetical protein